MPGQRKSKTFGGTSLPLESVFHQEYEIKSLKHGNTGHVLYKFPSKAHDWEPCWTMDLQTAKNGVEKYNQHLEKKEKNTE